MKTEEPKIIYLQIGEDADIKDFKKEDFESNAITWCWEKINDNDVEYISKQSIIEKTDEMIKGYESQINRQGLSVIKRVKLHEKIQALTELKESIKS